MGAESEGVLPSEPGCSSPVPVGPLPSVWLLRVSWEPGGTALPELKLSRQPWCMAGTPAYDSPRSGFQASLGDLGAGVPFGSHCEARPLPTGTASCGADRAGDRSHRQAAGGEPGTAPGACLAEKQGLPVSSGRRVLGCRYELLRAWLSNQRSRC